MTRLCVCVSGQVRALNEPLERLSSLLRGRDAVVIFSLWDRIGRKIDGALNLDQLWRVLDSDAELAIPSAWIGHKAFWDALPDLRRRLEEQSRLPQTERIREAIATHFPEAVVDIESADLLDLDFPHPVGEDRHSLRLLYKIWRVNKIKRALERRAGTFDVVVRMRPDLALSNVDLDRVIGDALAGKLVVGYWGEDRQWCSDGFAAGPSKVIDAYSALFARSIAEPFAWQHIHIDLAQHLGQLAIEVAPYADSETLMEDQKVTVGELHQALTSAPPVSSGSVAHALTEHALDATAKLASGRIDEALATMLQAADLARGAADDQCDGYFLVLARVLVAADLPVLGAVAALRSGAADRATRFRRGQAAIDCLIPGLSASPSSWNGLDITWDPIAWEQERQRAPAAAMIVAGTQSGSTGAPASTALTAAAALAVLRRLASQGRHELARSLLPRSMSAMTVAPNRSGTTPDIVLDLQRLAGEVGAVLLPDQLEALKVVALQHAGDVQALYGLAESLRQASRFGEAAAVQSRAVELDPRHAGARRQLAEILLALGHRQEASEQAAHALALHDCAEHRVLLAFIDHLGGKTTPPNLQSDLSRIDPSLHDRLRAVAGFDEFSKPSQARP